MPKLDIAIIHSINLGDEDEFDGEMNMEDGPPSKHKNGKVMDIEDAEVVAPMTLHDDEGHKTTSELRGNGGHEGEQVFEQMLEHGLDGVAKNNLAHEVGNPFDTQEAIVETPTKLATCDQAILDT
ncbi:unnamed protein product [Sphagnum balticum]